MKKFRILYYWSLFGLHKIGPSQFVIADEKHLLDINFLIYHVSLKVVI